jgi:hypothetical protein
MSIPGDQYTLSGLQPFTQYLVSIQVLNPKGAGPSATVVVMTDEGGQFVMKKIFPPRISNRL